MYPKKLSKILIPTATIERKNDNSHNSIIHYITGACSIDASQIGLAKQTKKIDMEEILYLTKFSKSMMCRATEAQNKLS